MKNTHCIEISTWAYLEIIALLSNKFNSNVMFLTKGFKFQMFLKWRQSIFRALLWHFKCSEIMGWYCWTCFNRSHLCTFIFCSRDDAVEDNWWHGIFFTFNSFPSLFISVHDCDCLFRRGLLGCNMSRCFVLYFFFSFLLVPVFVFFRRRKCDDHTAMDYRWHWNMSTSIAAVRKMTRAFFKVVRETWFVTVLVFIHKLFIRSRKGHIQQLWTSCRIWCWGPL